MNTTASCVFSSINEVLQQADQGSVNVTILVQTCPDVCTLVWGTGNPDLSGIGANISYIFQIILTVVFGPLFVALYGYRRQKIKDRGSEDSSNLRDTQEYLRNLQTTFIDVSGQFSIIVSVAGAVRLRQSPPFFEVAFLQSLAIVQFLGLFSVVFASGVAMSKPRNLRRVTVLCLYMSIEFCFYIVMQLSLQTSQTFVNSIQEMATSCCGYNGIWPGYNYVPPHPWTDWVGLAIGIPICCLLGIWLASCILRKRTSFRAGPVSFGFALGSLVYFVQLQRTRVTMRSATGAEFQDNQWGFGQVMAALLWTPLLIQVLYYGLLTWLPPLKPHEHPGIKPMCHQCRTCNTCAELGNLNKIGQVGTGATSADSQQGNGTQPKKESLSERFERWSKDHERRQNELRRQAAGSEYNGMP